MMPGVLFNTKEKEFYSRWGCGTSFIAILKDLKAKGKFAENKLFFANKSRIDVILESYFHDLLGGNIISVLD
jgi:hypothetical protein